MLNYVDEPDQNNELSFRSDISDEQKITALESRVSYLERIIKISQILNSTLDLDPLLKVISQAGIDLAGTEGCSILLYDEPENCLRFMPSTFSTDKNIRVPLEGSIAGLIFNRAKPILIRNVQSDPRWSNLVDEASDFETRSILGVPLKIKNQVIGVMELVNKRDEAGFGSEDIQIATALATQAAVAIENARLLSQLQQAYDELTELDRLKSDFVSVASHELRTPLAVILGYASFLRDEVSPEGSEQLDVVLSSAMRLRNLIDDMVNLRHVKNADLQLELSIFSIRDLVVEVLYEFQTLIDAKSLRVKVNLQEGDDDPVDVEADRQKIYLVVANVLSNAVKFTAEQGFIMVSVQRREHDIVLQIADTGVGIPEGLTDKIFDDFYQVERSLTRRFDGMGLGLSIAKGLIDLHRGSIRVNSSEGRGSQFVIVVPISQTRLR